MSDLDKDDLPHVPQEQSDDSEKMWRKNQRRIMDYFWKKRTRSFQDHVPTSVIYFLEDEKGSWSTDHDLFGLTNGIDNYLGAGSSYLAGKTSLNDEKGYELTAEGKVYLTKRHWPVIDLWERALELSPPTLSLFAAVVCFIAAVLGIVDFIWFRK